MCTAHMYADIQHIEIHSIQDEGTKVTIRMPAIHKEAEYENR